jgi:putative iron-regulated protein
MRMRVNRTFLATAAWLAVTAPVYATTPAAPVTESAVVASYASWVHEAYSAAHKDAVALQSAITDLLKTPTEATLTKAKEAWVHSRTSYNLTEPFRYYNGPVDVLNEKTGEEGPEARLNSWPLNEAYIDAVQGNPKAGIVNNPRFEITKATLKEVNQSEDEADVTTGYHAIEFLLWGQDLSKDAPGARPASDYTDIPAHTRRRAYLQTAADLLVDDLQLMVDAWKPGADNYAARFVAAPPKESLTKILVGVATLSGFEMASERMGTAVDSGDQEDEQSCFSDTTHQDIVGTAQAVQHVLLGTSDQVSSVYRLLQHKDAALAEKLATQLRETERLASAIPAPIDRDVLAAPEGAPGRVAMEAAIAGFQQQAELMKQAGKALGLEVAIASH